MVQMEELVGKKVKHAKFGEGKITSIKGGNIRVLFGVMIKEFPYPNSFNEGVIRLVEPPISTTKYEINSKRGVFFCFQGLQFANESSGGYIFAGQDPSISHWQRLKRVKVGDVIFHAQGREVRAIGVVEKECCINKRPPSHYLPGDMPNMMGLMVKIKYQFLNKPIITSNYKKEIIKLQGDHIKKGYPFDKNGEGNQGYLFNLNRPLANFFLNEIIKRNPSIKESEALKPKEDKKTQMKLCPICALNWIYEDESCCKMCITNRPLIMHSAKKNPTVIFQEEFTITNEVKNYPQKSRVGFQAYNSKGENVGIVCVCLDKRSPAYNMCELCVYPQYYNQYGQWHRIQSNGNRIGWTKLCEILKVKKSHKIYID